MKKVAARDDQNNHHPDLTLHRNRCVIWEEAINWVAHKNLAGWSFGPQLAFTMMREGSIEEAYRNGESRRDLAIDLLIEKTAQGIIKVYAMDTWEHKESELPYVVSPEFIRIAEFHEDDQVRFIHEDKGYFDLVVDFDDLRHEFWTEEDERPAGPSKTDVPERSEIPSEQAISLLAAPARSRPKFSRQRGAGRPREYDWPGFAVELTRRLRANTLPARKSECEAAMLHWCSENWLKEPAPSMVREWVKAFYDNFMPDREDRTGREIGNEIDTGIIVEPC